MHRRWLIASIFVVPLFIAHCSNDVFDAGGADASSDGGADATSGDAAEAASGDDAGGDANMDGGPTGCVEVPALPCAANSACVEQLVARVAPQLDAGGAFGLSIDSSYVYWVATDKRDPVDDGVVMRASRSNAGAMPPVGVSPRLPHPLGTAADGTYVYWADNGASPPGTFNVSRTSGGCSGGGCDKILMASLDAPRGLVAGGPQLLYIFADSTVLRFRFAAGGWAQEAVSGFGTGPTVVPVPEGAYAGAWDDGYIRFLSLDAGSWAAWGRVPANDGGHMGAPVIAADCDAIYVEVFSNDVYRLERKNASTATWIANVPDIYAMATDAKYLYMARENGGGIVRVGKDGTDHSPKLISTPRNVRSLAVTNDGIYYASNGTGEIYKIVH